MFVARCSVEKDLRTKRNSPRACRAQYVPQRCAGDRRVVSVLDSLVHRRGRANTDAQSHFLIFGNSCHFVVWPNVSLQKLARNQQRTQGLQTDPFYEEVMERAESARWQAGLSQVLNALRVNPAGAQGTPFLALFFFILPKPAALGQSGGLVGTYSATFAAFGLLAAMCGMVNKKVFADIVPQHMFTYVFAIDQLIEHFLGNFAGLAVGPLCAWLGPRIGGVAGV